MNDEKTRAARERKIPIGKVPLHEEKSAVILLRIPAGRFTMRVSSRYSYEPAGAADTIGFRCAIDAGSP